MNPSTATIGSEGRARASAWWRPAPGARRGLAVAGAVAWLIAIAVGIRTVSTYATAPGPSGPAPRRWPQASRLTLRSAGPTIVMFVHPRCACSRASLSELNLIMNDARARAAAIVEFVRPDGVEAGWERTDIWSAALRIPDTTVLTDDDGEEARRFGAETSGDTRVYDAAGALLFAGGITDARGHAGDNAGRRAVLDLLHGGQARPQMHTVYGCLLHSPPPGAP